MKQVNSNCVIEQDDSTDVMKQVNNKFDVILTVHRR